MKKAGRHLTEKQAEALLKKYSRDSRTFQLVLQHGKAVQNVALDYALEIQKQGHKIDINFIKTAALLHDLGRFACPPHSPKSIQHGLIGGKLLRKEGLPSHARVAETHLGAGLTKEEIAQQKLPLPKRDFLPKTIEEKLIAYVDKLIVQDRLATLSQEIERYRKENLPYSVIRRLIKLHNEMERLSGGKEFL